MYYKQEAKTTFKSEGLERESRIVGHFPPSSRVTGVKCFAAAVMTRDATLGLPKDKLVNYISKNYYFDHSHHIIKIAG